MCVLVGCTLMCVCVRVCNCVQKCVCACACVRARLCPYACVSVCVPLPTEDLPWGTWRLLSALLKRFPLPTRPQLVKVRRVGVHCTHSRREAASFLEDYKAYGEDVGEHFFQKILLTSVQCLSHSSWHVQFRDGVGTFRVIKTPM